MEEILKQKQELDGVLKEINQMEKEMEIEKSGATSPM